MNATHIVKGFDAELGRLTGEIADMGEAALRQIGDALHPLEWRTAGLAQRVIDGDDAIDAREREVSHEVLRPLALRQPSARDLREALAALRIAFDIERIADHATNIAENVWFVAEGEATLPPR